MNARDIETTLRARAAFDASTERIDPATRQRLRAIRAEALASRTSPRAGRWMWPASLATAGVLALVVFAPQGPRPMLTRATAPAHPATAHVAPATAPALATTAIAPDASESNAAAASGDALTLETADPDLLSDLEFYDWLATQPGHASGAGG